MPTEKELAQMLPQANQYADEFVRDYVMPKTKSDFWIAIRQAYYDGLKDKK